MSPAAVLELSAIWSDAQRVALAHQLIAGTRDVSCALQMNRLARNARLIADELSREAFARDCI